MDILEGKKIGKLYVIEKTKEKAKNNGEYKYKCLCDCGNEIMVRGSNLKYGNSKSCGCERIKKIAFVSKGLRKKNIRLYNIYNNMKQRCYYKKAKEYYIYGGRGISVCDQWKNNYIDFYKWAIANGYKKNLTIDRIDNNGNYCPENCRWVTMKEQANNKRNNRYIKYNNETKTLSEWANILNISSSTLLNRLKRMDVKEAFKK